MKPLKIIEIGSYVASHVEASNIQAWYQVGTSVLVVVVVVAYQRHSWVVFVLTTHPSYRT